MRAETLEKLGGSTCVTGHGGGLPGAALGHFPDYRQIAAEAALLHFNVCPKKWQAMSQLNRWILNRCFLDRIIHEQRVVWLATPPGEARPRSSYARELGYLLGNGYRISTNNCYLLPCR